MVSTMVTLVLRALLNETRLVQRSVAHDELVSGTALRAVRRQPEGRDLADSAQ